MSYKGVFMKILGVEVFPNGIDRLKVLKGDHPYLDIPRKNGDVKALKESLLVNRQLHISSETSSIEVDLSNQIPTI